jgi:hypothetical protein
MARVVEAVLERNFASSVAHIDQHSLENVLMMDQMGRAHAKEAITKL